MNKSTTNIEAIVAGHLCLDMTPKLDSAETIDPGKLIQSGPMLFSTGGAVANTGLALGKLGINTRLIGSVGKDDFAPIVRKRIDQPGIDSTILEIPDAPTSYSVVISPKDKDRSFIHCPGANDRFKPEWITDEMLEGAKLLHFGYPPIMKQTWVDGGNSLADLFNRARALGMITSLDSCGFTENSPAGKVNWLAWLKKVLPHVDCFTPSYDELAMMLQEEIDAWPHEAILKKMSAICLDFGCNFVMIKLGEHGLFASAGANRAGLKTINPKWENDAGKFWHERCYKVNVVGTTGAGDTTIAGFLAGLLKGKSMDETLQLATGAGALCVQGHDAISHIERIEKIEQRIAAGWEKQSQI